jgi:hypothetical protein
MIYMSGLSVRLMYTLKKDLKRESLKRIQNHFLKDSNLHLSNDFSDGFGYFTKNK